MSKEQYAAYAIVLAPGLESGKETRRYLVELRFYCGDRIYYRTCKQSHFRSEEEARRYAERYYHHYRGGTKDTPVWYIGEVYPWYFTPPTCAIRRFKPSPFS